MDSSKNAEFYLINSVLLEQIIFVLKKVKWVIKAIILTV